MVFSQTQQIALTIIPRVFGTLSIIGSSLIIYSILSDWEKKISTTYHRLLFAMSCVDILNSAALALSTAPFPKETPGVWGALGNTATCSAQGFMIQCGIAMPFYSFSLSVYYILTVRYDIDKETLRKKVEPLMHLVSFGYPFVCAIVALFLKLYNPLSNACHITPFPPGCDLMEDVECTRGANAKTIVWFTGTGWIIAFLILVPMNMALLYWTVWEQEKKMESYGGSRLSATEGDRRCKSRKLRVSRKQQDRKKQTRQVANQAMCYVGAFFIVFIWIPCVHLAVHFAFIDELVPLLCLLYIFYPLQGFLNLLVYTRPQMLRVHKRNPEWSYIRAFSFVIFRPKDVAKQAKQLRLSRLSNGRRGRFLFTHKISQNGQEQPKTSNKMANDMRTVISIGIKERTMGNKKKGEVTTKEATKSNETKSPGIRKKENTSSHNEDQAKDKILSMADVSN